MSDLEISSRFVGAEFRPRRIEVTARRAMNFAAGVFDSSDCYFDDQRPGGFIAHPMLACALTWPTSSRLHEYLVAEGFPLQVARQQVHYTETLIWYRAIRPGDRLSINGQIVAIMPHRTGTHLIVRYDAMDQEDQLAFTEFSGALLRGVRCLDEGQCRDVPEQVPLLETREPLWASSINLHDLAAHIYDGCADISFPIHTSTAFAKSVGLPGIIMQGTATVSYAVSELIRREADGSPDGLCRLDCRFTGMTPPGTQIIIQLFGRDIQADYTDLFWCITDTAGRSVVNDGRLRIKRK